MSYRLKKNKNILYHFTTEKGLLSIVKDMQLKLSTFENLNDLHDGNITNRLIDHSAFNQYTREIEQYILEHCKLICFCSNYKYKNYEQFGYNHPRQWAQYANNNKGACIAINEQAFLKQNREILRGKFSQIYNVSYRKYTKEVDIKESDSEKFIKKNCYDLFFRKHFDWSQEKERRFFGIDMPECLSIENCVEFIGLGQNMTNSTKINLIDLISTPGNKCYKQLRLKYLKKQINYLGDIGLYTENNLAPNSLKSILEKRITDLEEYSEWLKEYLEWSNMND